MDFIKIRIGDVLEKMDEDFGKTVDDMFNLINPKFNLHQNIWRPSVDIFEDAREIVVVVDIAGVKTENLHIELDHRTLKIHGIRREKPLAGGARYRLAEIPSGYFERTINLPVPIDTDNADATYKDGLLQLTMAKLPLNRAFKIHISNT